MKSKVYKIALALIIASATVPAQADIIADQSRISVFAPKSPNLDQVMFPKYRLDLLN